MQNAVIFELDFGNMIYLLYMNFSNSFMARSILKFFMFMCLQIKMKWNYINKFIIHLFAALVIPAQRFNSNEVGGDLTTKVKVLFEKAVMRKMLPVMIMMIMTIMMLLHEIIHYIEFLTT